MKDRFASSSICYDEKYPILLRTGSVTSFTKLIVGDSHQKALHHETETTVSHICLKLWITKERKAVKEITKKEQ